jgi:hypothetical protein
MAWERRHGSTALYYTRSRRVGGRVVREYVGSDRDPFVVLIAWQDAHAREQRRRERVERLAAEARERGPEGPLAGWIGRSTCWSRRRCSPPGSTVATATAGNGGRTMDGEPDRDDATLATLRSLAALARGGDQGAADRLADHLAEHPGLWAEVADLADTVETVWVDLMTGPDLAARAAQRQQLAELRAQLAGPDASATTELLARRAALAWVLAQHADASVALKRAAQPELFEYAQRRADRMARRFEAAVRALAGWRRLEAAGTLEPRREAARPAVQGHAEAAPPYPRLACGG